MLLNKAGILKALSTVEDPDLKKDLVSLNMIQEVSIDGRKIAFTLMLTTPACPLKQVLHDNCVDALKQNFGEDISVEIAFDSQVTSNRRGNSDILSGIRNIIAVASGKGGVGKSTVAVNLAIGLAKFGSRVGLLDTDIHGPSLPRMLGIRNTKPATHEEKGKLILEPVATHGIKAMSMGMLIDESQAVIWRGPMLASALKQMMLDVDWGNLDYLVLDLPPGTGDVHLTLAQQFPLTGAVVVTTPQQVSMSDNIKTIEMFRNPQINIPVLGIVENMAWFTPVELPENRYFVFGKGAGKELAESYEIPLLAQIPLLMGVSEQADSGLPAVLNDNKHIRRPFMDMSGKVAQQIAVQNAAAVSKENSPD